ncbi:hypothetical protein [Devosia sp.]|uniref:hypothetical protein n=1 Tax=Devosia sp. TaxID=1871048 RepID=UPI00261F8EDB|nr:hypothetical protein [Devosia sp.]
MEAMIGLTAYTGRGWELTIPAAQKTQRASGQIRKADLESSKTSQSTMSTDFID